MSPGRNELHPGAGKGQDCIASWVAIRAWVGAERRRALIDSRGNGRSSLFQINATGGPAEQADLRMLATIGALNSIPYEFRNRVCTDAMLYARSAK